MVVLSLFIDHELRRALWVSGTYPGLPLGYPPSAAALGGAMPNMFLWPRATADYYLFNAAALFTGRIPWPLFGNGLLDGLARWSDRLLCNPRYKYIGRLLEPEEGRKPVILALSLLSLSYLVVCVVMINMPESDKLLPTLAFGIYAYGRWCALESRPCTEAPDAGRFTGRQ